MALVMDVFAQLSLSPPQARTVGGVAIAIVIVLDLMASADDVSFNTPRDWLIRITQWRSFGLWSKENRQRVVGEGRGWLRVVPFNYLPMTGAIVPFMLAALVGHFFHPGWGPVLGPGGMTGLGICGGVGFVLAAVTYVRSLGRSEMVVLGLAVAGVVCGVAVWPV